jgi:tetratricopeptide (TPR) repeat protein
MDGTEKISLALAIKDVEDRDLALQKLSKELLAEKDLEKAIGVTHFIENSYEKVEALNLIAESLAKSGDLERSFWFFNEAETEAVRCTELWQQSELLHKLAGSLFKAGAKNKAISFWEKAISICKIGEKSESQQSSLDASSVLTDIIVFIAKNVDAQKAFQLSQEIKNIHHKERTLNKISEYQNQVQLVA